MTINSKMYRKRAKLLQKNYYNCYWCDYIFTKKEITLDHLLPRYYGGSELDHNLVTSCEKCNKKRGEITVLFIWVFEAKITPKKFLKSYTNLEPYIYWFLNMYEEKNLFKPPYYGINWLKYYMLEEVKLLNNYYVKYFGSINTIKPKAKKWQRFPD